MSSPAENHSASAEPPPGGITRPRRRARHRREEPRSARGRRATAPLTWRACQTLAWRALALGATRVDTNHVEWDIAPHCSRPYERVHAAGPLSITETREHRKERADKARAFMSVTIKTPCRSCESCLEHRRALWSARARAETASAPETLFLTLTFTHDWQNRFLGWCREEAASDGIDFDALTLETQFARRVRFAGEELTKYIKLIRSLSPAPVVGDKPLPNWRYLAVAEAHKAGGDGDARPHFHMLLHNIHEGYHQPSMKLMVHDYEVDHWPFLEAKWAHLGFASVRRVTSDKATYLCKYLAKDSRSRVRASESYGSFEYEKNALLVHSCRGVNAMTRLARSVIADGPVLPTTTIEQ